MKPRLFPTHFRLILEDAEWHAVADLWEHDPKWETELDLLHDVLKAGIRSMNRLVSEERKDPHHINRNHWEARRRSEACARSGVSRDELPNYVGIPLEEPLRQRLDAAYAEHAIGSTEEDFLAMLLELGLDHVQHATRSSEGRRKSHAVLRRLVRHARLRALLDC